MKYFVADSYKNFDIVSDAFENDKGKMCVKIKRPCPRCSGLGIIVARVENGQMIPISVDSGICYKCGGSRFEEKIVRAYTEKEYNALQRAKTKREEKKAAEAAARERDLTENADVYKRETAKKVFGFNDDLKLYIVYGGNTYNIKDTLKSLGGRFDPVLKWYFSTDAIELPEGYHLAEVNFDDICIYHPLVKNVSYKDDAEDTIKRIINDLREPSNTVYYPGEIKDRIRNLLVKVSNIRGFNGYYGYTYIYTFTLDNYAFVWMTSKELDIEVGDTVDLTGTIKKFDEYNNEYNTYLTRCIIKEVA